MIIKLCSSQIKFSIENNIISTVKCMKHVPDLWRFKILLYDTAPGTSCCCICSDDCSTKDLNF